MTGPLVAAVVPVKRFARSKERLAALMTPAERAQLAATMLDDVLSAIVEVANLDRVAVVTGDATAAAIARSFRAVVVDDPIETGMNAAVTRAVQALSADALLIVPGDIPNLRSADLRRVLALLTERSVALAPAVRDGGTNLLALMPPDAIAPCFGLDSFARHVEAAWQAGIEPAVLNLDSVRLDIDSLEDVAAFLALPARTRTHALLTELSIAARIDDTRGRPAADRGPAARADP